MTLIGKIWKSIAGAFFPRGYRCIVCGKEIPSENADGLCSSCTLTRNDGEICQRCGRSIHNEADYCNDCLDHKYHYDAARSALVYADNVSRLIYGLKYGSKKYLADYLAPYMRGLLKGLNWQYDAVTCTPISAKRLRSRGYNQAALLAAAALYTDEPDKFLSEALIKIKDIPYQARLSRNERFENIRGMIAFNPAANVKGLRILHIDDVLTTGATVNECARILKQNGAKEVKVLTLAATPQKGFGKDCST